MELDKRIKEGKRPLTCIDIEQSKEFVGKLCLFSDDYRNYKDIQEYSENPQYIGTLAPQDNVNLQEYPFKNENDGGSYRLVLPLDWVKEPEKKWRPYTGIEFAEKFGIWVGHVIRIRDRPENAGQEYEYKIMFVGYRWYKGMFEVFINGCWIDLLTLFELYEYMEDGEWHKFGVEE